MTTTSPNRVGTRSRVSVQASPAVILPPNTARPRMRVSTPVSSVTATNWTAKESRLPPYWVRKLSSGGAAAGFSTIGAREVSMIACPTARGIAPSAAAIADRPRTLLGLERISLIAPSRMSPRPSGRNGMMPGRIAGGGALAP